MNRPLPSRFFFTIALLVIQLFAVSARAEQPAAKAVMVSGRVTLFRNGKGHSLEVGEALMRDDRLHTTVDAFTILKLENGHLVRIDEDLKLQVKKIVMLRAKPSTVSVSLQLKALLYPDEREQYLDPSTGVLRPAGWRAGVIAVETVPVSPAKSKRRKLTSQTRRAPRPAPPPAVKLPSPPEEAKLRQERPAATDQPMAPAGPERNLEEAPPRVGGVEPAVTQAARGFVGETRVLRWKKLKKDLEVRRCAFTALPASRGPIALFLRLKDGKVARLRLPGARPVPACLISILHGRTLQLPRRLRLKQRGWIRLSLSRP